MAKPNHQPTVLIVDDEADLIEILCFTLQDEGFRTLSATNLMDALALLRSERVDVLLTDVRMPGGGGMKLLEEAKECRPNVAVVLMTGYSDLSPEEVSSKGASAFISKPFDHDSLIDTIRKALT